MSFVRKLLAGGVGREFDYGRRRLGWLAVHYAQDAANGYIAGIDTQKQGGKNRGKNDSAEYQTVHRGRTH